VLVFSLLFLFFFFFAGWSACPVGYADLSEGWLGKYHVMFGAHLFGLLNVSWAGLELAVAVVMAAAHLFS
jgi:hypothetical protein